LVLLVEELFFQSLFVSLYDQRFKPSGPQEKANALLKQVVM